MCCSRCAANSARSSVCCHESSSASSSFPSGPRHHSCRNGSPRQSRTSPLAAAVPAFDSPVTIPPDDGVAVATLFFIAVAHVELSTTCLRTRSALPSGASPMVEETPVLLLVLELLVVEMIPAPLRFRMVILLMLFPVLSAQMSPSLLSPEEVTRNRSFWRIVEKRGCRNE